MVIMRTNGAVQIVHMPQGRVRASARFRVKQTTTEYIQRKKGKKSLQSSISATTRRNIGTLGLACHLRLSLTKRTYTAFYTPWVRIHIRRKIGQNAAHFNETKGPFSSIWCSSFSNSVNYPLAIEEVVLLLRHNCPMARVYLLLIVVVVVVESHREKIVDGVEREHLLTLHYANVQELMTVLYSSI